MQKNVNVILTQAHESINLINKEIIQVVFGLLLPKFINHVCPLTSFGFFNLCTGITLRCCAVTKDGGWEHPGHCCNAIKPGLRT